MTGVMVPLDAVIVIVAVALVVGLWQREVVQIGCGTFIALVLITAVAMMLISRGEESHAVGAVVYGTMSGALQSV